MSPTVSMGLIIALAFVLANLPFINGRLFAVYRLKTKKPGAVRLLELLLGYFFVGFVARLAEQHAGQVALQDWQFYVVTASMFLTLAFPGFVYRYLLKHTS